MCLALKNRKIKISDFFDGNIGTFNAKYPYFPSKKSDVLQLPEERFSPPTKKVYYKSPTFSTPRHQTSCVY